MHRQQRRATSIRSRHPVGRCAGAALLSCLALGTAAPALGPSALAATPAPTVGDLQVLPANTQLWVGTSTLVLDLRDGAGTRLDPRTRTAELVLTDPDLGVRPGVPIVARQLIPGGPWWATAEVQLDRVGDWTLTASAAGEAGPLRGSAQVRVSPDDGTLPLGSAFPPLRTPTLRSSGYRLARITTDPEPEPSFYWTSVDQALADQRAFVLALDSVGFVTSDACGGAVEHLRHLRAEFPGLLLIHAEPWVVREAGGRLLLDPVDGPPRPAPWTTAIGARAVPWILVVDEHGRLRAKFTDVFGSDELRAAVRTIAPWAPGGH